MHAAASKLGLRSAQSGSSSFPFWRKQEQAGKCKEAEIFHCLPLSLLCLLRGKTCSSNLGDGHGPHFIAEGLFSAARVLHNDWWLGAED